uniref:Uncharacterized protein n=1 Tax=Ficedula albicollis TaxID=59894 RepID=A0A803W6P3_FICAL
MLLAQSPAEESWYSFELHLSPLQSSYAPHSPCAVRTSRDTGQVGSSLRDTPSYRNPAVMLCPPARPRVLCPILYCYIFTHTHASYRMSRAVWGHTDPGAGHTDPGTGHTDPGAGHTDPGTGHTDPGAGHTDPGTGHTDPGAGHTDPGTGHTDPGAGHTDPGTGHTDPGAGHTDPGTGHTDPGHTDSGKGYTYPGTGHTDPYTGHTDPYFNFAPGSRPNY